jgi:hypothetical protein
MRNVYVVLVGEPEEKRPLDRFRHNWQKVDEINFKEIIYEGVDWIQLAQGRDR